MKYVAIVEIEFTTTSEAIDPLGMLRAILERSRELIGRLDDDGPLADHYHIIEQPRQLGKLE